MAKRPLLFDTEQQAVAALLAKGFRRTDDPRFAYQNEATHQMAVIHRTPDRQWKLVVQAQPNHLVTIS
jgi:hypothetical protein